MGIDIIRLGERVSGVNDNFGLTGEDLVQLTSRDYDLGDPGMKIWLMVGYKDRPLFPWWQYDHKMDQDIQR